MNIGSGLAGRIAARNRGAGAIMKYSPKIISFVVAAGAFVPLASAQTASTPPATTQSQQNQPAHPKANGAAKGAVIGAAAGNPAAGAALGAGHSRRQARR
jgi:hypothetical protein